MVFIFGNHVMRSAHGTQLRSSSFRLLKLWPEMASLSDSTQLATGAKFRGTPHHPRIIKWFSIYPASPKNLDQWRAILHMFLAIGGDSGVNYVR
jgi:hypothetical protein